MDKLIKYEFPDSLFNYQRVLNEICINAGFSMTNSSDMGVLGEWTNPMSLSTGSATLKNGKDSSFTSTMIRGEKGLTKIKKIIKAIQSRNQN